MSIGGSRGASSFEFQISIRVISRILIPTDFSPASWHATQVGLELSRLHGNSVISFLHIYPVSARYTVEKSAKAVELKLVEVKERMNKLSNKLADLSSDKINNVVLSGNVEETMLRFIKEHEFDLVIVGINSNGHTNEMGSHTISVIQESGVPVLIVPNISVNGAIAS